MSEIRVELRGTKYEFASVSVKSTGKDRGTESTKR